MSETHWTEAYLDFAYVKGGDTVAGFNCWGFFRHVERRQFGIDVPAFSEPAGLSKLVRKIRNGAVALSWEQVTVPRAGDAVLMAHWKYPSHVGIWVDDIGDGRVLHCVEGAGPACHSRAHLRIAKWKIVAFYRPVDLDRARGG